MSAAGWDDSHLTDAPQPRKVYDKHLGRWVPGDAAPLDWALVDTVVVDVAGYLDDWDRRNPGLRQRARAIWAGIPEGGERCPAVRLALLAEHREDGTPLSPMGKLTSLVRLAEQGHEGARDAAEGYAAEIRSSDRDQRRVIEYALSYVVRDGITPDGDKGCCAVPIVELDVIRRKDRKASPVVEPVDPEEEGDEQAKRRARAQEQYDIAVKIALGRLRANEEAKRLYALERRGERPSLRSKLIDVRDLKDVSPPAWLIRGLVPKASIGFMAGKYGTYKSFVAVSLACSLAAGKAWQGNDEWRVDGPVRVLYVAAEGAGGVAQRVQAWEHVHGEIPAGQLAVYPEPVRLNDPEDVTEFEELVAELGADLVVIDTFHRSAPGSEENSNTEVGMVLAAMAGIRDRCGTTTLFVDHTGHAGRTMRGATAKGDDADFALIIDLPGDDRSSDQQRTLRIVKLKDSRQDGEWPLRLVDVPSIGEDGSAYVEIGEVGGLDGAAEIFGDRGRWWEIEIPLPECVGGLRGRGAGVALDIYRVLSYVNGSAGLTKPEIIARLRERPGKAPERSVCDRALALLASEGITEPGETASRVTLARGLK